MAEGGSTKRLLEVAGAFLKLGCIAFGGPAAHVGLMEEEFVRRRRWLSREEFLDVLGAMNLLPGPNSTEMTIHLGWRRAGWPGFFVGGLAFILPAALITSAVAWFYVRFGALPQGRALLYGVKPTIIAVIALAVIRLARSALRGTRAAVLAVAAFAACACGLDPLAALLAAGALSLLWTRLRGGPAGAASAALAALPAAPLSAAAAAPFGLGALFLFFLKVGGLLYGSGYVLVAFIRGDLVQRWHWLTEAQLLDAVAAGQITPGPLFSTATFVGYLLGGAAGAAVATAAIFVPAFAYVAASAPILPKLRRSPSAAAFLDGVNAAAVALMALVAALLGRTAIVDPFTALLAAACLVAALRFRVNAAWLVVGGALLGLAVQALR
ncbi:MAG: chromate efflux transporter [Candidatus Polarisedimenticolia bacterium]